MSSSQTALIELRLLEYYYLFTNLGVSSFDIDPLSSATRPWLLTWALMYGFVVFVCLLVGLSCGLESKSKAMVMFGRCLHFMRLLPNIRMSKHPKCD